MKKGFTLVELSIVLVIIGLLIGGILVAQSMIGTTKMQAQLRQIQQFDIAVTLFKERYRYLPGDTPNMPSDGDGADVGSGFGNGDGFLQNRNGIQQFCQVTLFIGECDEFWKQLGDTGMIKGTYTNDYSGGVVPDVGAPRAIYKHTTVLPYYFANYDATSNYYILQGNTHTPALVNGTRGRVLASVEVMAMDTKVDDGKPTTGNVRGITNSLNMITPATQCLTGTEYDLTNKNEVCSPLFKMMAFTGTGS